MPQGGNLMVKAIKDFRKAWRDAEEERAERTRQAVAERWDEVHHDPDTPVVANPQGDVTVTHFFDYV